MKLTIELTHYCPLNCIHCSSWYLYPQLIDFKTIVNIFNEYPITEVVLSGGEPFFYPFFYQVVEYVINKGYKISLNTCGIFQDKVDTIVTDWVPQPLGGKYEFRYDIPYEMLLKFDRIYVSIYGDEKVHNQITRVDSFFDTLEFYCMMRMGVSWINRVKDVSNRVIINTPIFSKQQVASLIDFLVEYDISKRILDHNIHFIRLLKHGRAKTINVMSREEQLSIALEIKREFPDRIHISESLLHERCNWEQKLTLLPNGELIHCVAGKLYSNPNQKFVCDKITENSEMS